MRRLATEGAWRSWPCAWCCCFWPGTWRLRSSFSSKPARVVNYRTWTKCSFCVSARRVSLDSLSSDFDQPSEYRTPRQDHVGGERERPHRGPGGDPGVQLQQGQQAPGPHHAVPHRGRGRPVGGGDPEMV
ncbi:uncharacterized protein [Callorhinus ursinus]|uniref:uncharacterized protein isoform X2 n=1 Tax=Callorhinus ursinus TaxID=34884 RepID=UPI003CD029C7